MTRSSNPSRNTFSLRIQKQIKDVLSEVAKLKGELDTVIPKFKPTLLQKDATQILEYLFLKFHTIAKQIQKRQRNREPFRVNDEYDVQDLLHGLLRIYFEDIRAEEYFPSYGGVQPRVDFFLKREQIAIEAKMTGKNRRRKKIREELILDKEYYSKKKDCNFLLCMVYDPEELIGNPRGFEDDLNEKSDNFEAMIFVVPKKT